MGTTPFPTLAELGVGAIGLTTRYIGNDANLNVENCLLDIAATVGFCGPGGTKGGPRRELGRAATMVPYYQAQAERPTVTSPPGASDPI